MRTDKFYWFHELPAKLQKQIEKRMIDLVTNKQAHINCDDTDYVWIEVPLQDEEEDGDTEGESIGVRRENEEYSNCANYYMAPISKYFLVDETIKFVEIVMKKLPENVALLLGVIHRPVFELYKERVLERDKDD